MAGRRAGMCAVTRPNATTRLPSPSRPLGPARAFLDVRLGADGRPQVDGVTRLEFGTRVSGSGDGGNGVFAGWHWDGTRVEVHTDRLGFFPLFYFADDHRFCVSPSLGVLLAQGAPRELDLDAIGVFMRLGYFMDDDTAFRAIRAVPPVRRLTWSGGAAALDPWRSEPREVACARGDAIDGYIELMRESVRRRLPGEGERFVLPLSGGADSRHLLLELWRQGRRPDAVVTATQFAGCHDVPVARALAARLGLEHVVVDGVVDACWSQELRKNCMTSFCADEHVWYLPVAEHLAPTTDVTFDGMGGDILSAQVELSEPVMRSMREGRIDLLLADVLSESREAVLADAVTPECYRSMPAEAVRERVAEELTRHLESPNAWASFYFAHWERREITLVPHSMLAGLTVHTPFLDNDVVDFLAALPPEILLGGRFHADALRCAYPEVADVPFARDLSNARPVTLVQRARRLPHRLAVQVGVSLRSRNSEMLRLAPPAFRRPTAGRLGGFNRRLIWLRQVELLADDALPPV